MVVAQQAVNLKMGNPIDTSTPPARYPAETLQLMALLALLLLTSWVYWPGLSGPLLLDDFRNLTPLGAGGGVTDLGSFFTFVFGNTSGLTGRPVSMLSFLIDAQSWPPLVASFKHTNIMIHLLCGVVLFWLCLLLFRHFLPASKNYTWLALLVCALWLLHPLNVSTTLYVVQRMTQLMTLFALASLLCYVAGRTQLVDRPRRSLLLLLLTLFPFGLLAVLSKENGALLLLLIVIMEATLFATAPKTKWFTLWYRLGVVFPLVIVAAYLLYSFPDVAANYDFLSFSLGERLLTQLRIVSLYIFEIMLPNTLGAGLFHDDIQVSTSLFSPLSTLVSALFIASVLVSAFTFRRKLPVYSFGVLWFFAMQLLESTYVPLELYFEHRNYMAMIGPLVAAVWTLSSYVQQLQLPNPSQLLSAACILLLSFMAWLTWGLSLLWSDSGNLFAYWALDKPASSRAQITWADYLADIGAPEAGLARLLIASEYYPDEASLLLHTWTLSCRHGLQPPFSLEQITAVEGLENHREDVNYQLRELVEGLQENRCAYPPLEEVVTLFERVGMLSLSAGASSAYHLLFSEVYVAMGQLDPALIQLSLSFRNFPNPEVIIRQALLAASAGNYADSLVFLGRAREAEQERQLFQTSYLAEIDRLESDFRRLLEAQ